MTAPKTGLAPIGRGSGYVIAVAAAFVVLGAWHHVAFSHTVGELAFFKNAFDEDTYMLNLFGVVFARPDRLLSDAIAWILASAFGSLNATLIALDAIMPPLIFLSAYYAAGALFENVYTRVLYALLLVFAQDMFSLGNEAAWPGPFPTLLDFQHFVGTSFVPSFETSFLTINRSPEPQVAYAVGFALTGVVLRGFRAGTLTTSQRIGALLLQTGLVICYALVSYPLIAIESAAGLILLLRRKAPLGLFLVVLAVVSLVAAAVSARLVIGPGTANPLTFPSRLPVVTVSVLAAVPAVLAFGLLAVLDPGHRDRFALAAAIAATPLIVTNQQIVTGLMISARDWERYINLSLVVLAVGVGLSPFRWPQKLPGIVAIVAALAIAVFVTQTSRRSYGFWLRDNLKSLALGRAIATAHPCPELPLVMDEPGYAPTIEVRLGHPINSLLNFTDGFRHPIPSTQAFVPTRLSAALFEYWRRRDVSEHDAEAILRREAAQHGGFYSAFLFNNCEYWAPCTDGRAVKTEKILSQIPQVISAYAGYHASDTPVAFVTFDKPTGTLLGSGTAGPFVASVFTSSATAAACPR
ncbi:hypothetical protein [Bradyrhizobium sp.]|uniref:hypothetical protein n=1 Tax=Bradyrhizobium sp. TaxID=376 RepID=UPI002389E785|nr:hypothetical protein [Bradyrhizobium sp.]MDE2378986.1 hypothetical protein [Bradyrhizobium sp.]